MTLLLLQKILSITFTKQGIFWQIIKNNDLKVCFRVFHQILDERRSLYNLKFMEYLTELFEQRLQQLKRMFLNLLHNLQQSKLFASKPSHAQYRIEYVGAMVSEAFKAEQQQTIKKLLKKVSQLKKKLEEREQKQSTLKNKEYQQSICQSSGSFSWQHYEQRPKKISKPSQESIRSKQWGTPDTKLSTFSDWTDEDNIEVGKKNSSIEDSISSCNFKYLKLKF